MMSNIRLYWILLIFLLVGSCKEKSESYPKAIPRTVRLTTIDTLRQVTSMYTGTVDAKTYSDLSFLVSGPMIELNVDAGEKVRKGQIIAKVDPLDFELSVNAAKSAYLSAKSRYDRALKLSEKQAISTQEVEQTKADLDSKFADFETAKKALSDTKLIIPFDGFIEQKYVENYQKIHTGEPIVKLVNPEDIEISFLVPEIKIAAIQDVHQLEVEFDNYPEKWFKAKIKYVVDASPNGSGIPITLLIDDENFKPMDYDIYPGFSCKIAVVSNNAQSRLLTIPLSAVFVDDLSGETNVWVCDTTSKTVNRVCVKVKQLIGSDRVQIYPCDQLHQNAKIVSLGATFLTQGDTVQILN